MFKKDEILEIEKQIKELEERRKTILDEVKKKENEKKAERKKEVEEAYDKFVKLLNAYENDFGGGYKVNLTGKFSM